MSISQGEADAIALAIKYNFKRSGMEDTCARMTNKGMFMLASTVVYSVLQRMRRLVSRMNRSCRLTNLSDKMGEISMHLTTPIQTMGNSIEPVVDLQ